MKHTKNQGELAPSRSRLGLTIPDVLIDLNSELEFARKQGRRDHLIQLDSEGWCPELRVYWQTTQERVALISEELRDRIALVDEKIAKCHHELRDLERTRLKEEDPLLTGDSIDIRASRRREHARQAAVDRIRELKIEIATQVSNRRHLHEQARDTVRQLTSAFLALAAAYRRGQEEGPLLSRLLKWFGLGRRRAENNAPAEPNIDIDFQWFTSDIPFMDQFIDTEAQGSQIITWAYRAFLDPGSRDDSHPVGALLTGE